MVSYLSERFSDLRTVYQVEYVDSPDDWDRICSQQGEPCELYEVKTFEDPGEAMTLYLRMFFSMCGYLSGDAELDRIYDVKLFEQTMIGNEVIREKWIEPSRQTLYSLRSTFGKAVLNHIAALESGAEEMAQELEDYKNYISSFGNDAYFRRWQKAQH